MTRRRRALAVGLVLLAAAAVPASASAAGAPAPAPAPVRLSVRFGDGAHLGASTSMSVAVHVDAHLAPTTEFRLLTPPSVTLVSSRLGAASCTRPASVLARVMSPVVQQPCPANSLMGTGSATAGLLLNPDETLFGAGSFELHAGAPVDDKPGLLVVVNTYNPLRMQLTYTGYLYVPPAPFGVGMAIKLPQIPQPPFGAAVALSNLRLTVGAHAITYTKLTHGRRVSYHPGGIPLPPSCPAGGFHFRAILRFADATRRTADAVVPCPPARH